MLPAPQVTGMIDPCVYILAIEVAKLPATIVNQTPPKLPGVTKLSAFLVMLRPSSKSVSVKSCSENVIGVGAAKLTSTVPLPSTVPFVIVLG